MMRVLSAAIAVIFILWGCEQQPSVGRAKQTLIPLDVLTGVPDFWRPLLSPDGSKISYIALYQDAPNIWVAPATNFGNAKAVTSVTGQGVTASNVAGYTTYRWTADSRYILYLQDQRGNERWHLMATDVMTGTTRDLTPMDDVQVRLVASSHQQPNVVLVEINDRRPDRHDLYRVDIPSGVLTLVLKNDDYVGVFADNQLVPRLAVASSSDGGFDIFKWQGDSTWTLFIRLSQQDTSALIRAVEQHAWSFSADNRKFRIYDSRGRNTWSMAEIDLGNGSTRELASNEQVDIDSVGFDEHGKLALWRANRARPVWHTNSGAIQRDLDFLQAAYDGDLEIINRSANGGRWLVSYSYSHRSSAFYLYERETQNLVFLASQMPAVDLLDLPALQSVEVTSRDGIELVSYLLLPKGSDADLDGVPDTPLPMIVYVHGGPNDERAIYGYSSRLQWLANRGYAVMNVNYRGSPGFGKHFLNAQNLEWGNKMNLDVVDQVLWAVERGIAKNNKIGILGGSFGGFEVLSAMTKTPDVFACGVALAAPSEMESFINIWWENFIPASNMAYKAIILGDPATPEGLMALKNSSPLNFAHKAKNPLLIVQGDQDTRVPTRQAKLMVDALVEHNVPVTYVLYPDEGHGVVRPGNSRSFNAIVEAFFGNCLGGYYQPLVDQLKEANVQVPVGAEHIPGLLEAASSLP